MNTNSRKKRYLIFCLIPMLALFLIATACGKRAGRDNSAYIEMTWTVEPLGEESKSVWIFHFDTDGNPLAFGGLTDSGKTAYTVIETEPPEYLPFLKEMGKADFFEQNSYYNDNNGTEYVFFNDKTGKIIYYTKPVADTSIKVKYINDLPAELAEQIK